jgi:two-component system, OmpR family, response regulator
MHKKRILIVDDDVSSTRLTKLNLEATNRFDVRIEKWPEDTLATAREYKPDLIILDIMMPGLFGGDVAERLRADPQFRFVPILFVSAAVRKARVADHNGMLAGFPVLAKPITVEALLARIEMTFQAPSSGPRCESDFPGKQATNTVHPSTSNSYETHA